MRQAVTEAREIAEAADPTDPVAFAADYGKITERMSLLAQNPLAGVKGSNEIVAASQSARTVRSGPEPNRDNERMTPVDAPLLVGRYVRLEPLELRHTRGLAEAAAEDRSTYAYSRVPDGERGAEVFVRAAQRDWAAGTDCAFATVRIDGAAGPRVVGSTRFMDLQRWLGRTTGPPDVAEIGNTWLAASAQRTAANTEAKLLMLTHAFEVWHVQRLFLKTDVRNERSRAAIERLGASFEGVLRRNMPSWADGGVRDTAYYSILPDEWPAVRAGLRAKLGIPDATAAAD